MVSHTNDLADAERNALRDRRVERIGRAILFCMAACAFVAVFERALYVLVVGAALLFEPEYFEWNYVAVGATALGNGIVMLAVLTHGLTSMESHRGLVNAGLVAAGFCAVGFVVSIGGVVRGVLDPAESPWWPLLWAFFSALSISLSLAFLALDEEQPEPS